MDFTGSRIELRGFLRTEDVSSHVGLWMRQDGEARGSLAFDNMSSQRVAGTRDWAEYSISLPVRADANVLFFGVLLSGSGKAWADDLQLLVDGKPISEAPARTIPKKPFEDDRRFTEGSGLTLESLSKAQVENLARLGKVWGYLKYHHPAVTAGRYHWDFELLTVLPKVVAAKDRAEANAIMATWVSGLSEGAPCDPCADLKHADLHQRPRLEWLGNESELGAPLSKALSGVHRARPVGQQFFVSKAPNVGNPVFGAELAYRTVKPGDSGFQLLALFRYWNIIEYWFPNRDIIGESWDAVLSEFVPRLALARTRAAYERQLMALITRINDTHANLQSAPQARPPEGSCPMPAAVRFVENQPVISAVVQSATKPVNLQRGDILLAIDGAPVSTLIEEWKPYYSASNEVVRLRDIGRGMMFGACGKASLRVRRDGKALDVEVDRAGGINLAPMLEHDRPGEAFQLLTEKVAYLKMSAVKAAEVPEYLKRAAGTEGLIIDSRNYPSDFLVFALGTHLVDKPTDFVTFTQMDLSNPGASHWASSASLTPAEPRYPGKVIVLVDENSISSSEYHAMAFRAAPRAIVMGSTTAGADGNVSLFSLPGGMRSLISGIGVFYPDRKPTQRIGIVPDIVVTPTIEGIRTGRDEVLEAAIRQIGP
jgi:C-terminal processing protease CtpA/Prc